MRVSRVVGGSALVAGALAGTAATAVSWRYSTVLISPKPRTAFPERVLGSAPDGVVLRSGRLVAQPGVWGLRTPAGADAPGRLVVLGDVVRTGRGQLVRELLAGSPPPIGPAVVDVGPFDPDPSARGLHFDDVVVGTPLGPAPAWSVPTVGGLRPPTAPRTAPTGSAGPTAHPDDTGTAVSSADVIVAVHGRGSSRREALRVMPALHRAGLHQLVLTYRNDDGAPAAPDHRYHLGDTEWQDLEAGVRYALDRGARRIVLFGWSMGAAIGGAFLDRSPLARHVAAVVWDAPLLDWRSTMHQQARNRHLPRSLVGPALAFTGRRIGIDVDRFDLVRHPPAVRPPTLVVHSDADSAVPVTDSRALAAAAPALGWPLRYLETAGVEHTASWNADPARYEAAVTGFLREVLG